MSVCLLRSLATNASGDDATAFTTGWVKAPVESSSAKKRRASGATVSSTAMYAVVSRRKGTPRCRQLRYGYTSCPAARQGLCGEPITVPIPEQITVSVKQQPVLSRR
jgi:hypothetical protein